MSVKYTAIGWNRQKIIYDALIIAGVSLYILLYIYINMWTDPNANFITIRMRSFGSCAFLLLHIILSIGPLARLNSKFLPLLYNRRHLGVMMFIVACFHAYYVTIEYHKWGKLEPVFNIFLGNTNFATFTQFPFQVLGALALLIFFFMAITSHDFWLKNLTPAVWKYLHMFVYLAYSLIILHVALGPLQFQSNIIFFIMIFSGTLWIILIHLLAALKEKKTDSYNLKANKYISVCDVDAIKENHAKIFVIRDERVALFKKEGKIYAVSNICAHQNGPLGEGKIINGCITCPWHGYQYLPESGRAPEPFVEKIPTYNVKIENKTVYVDPKPNPPGTKTESTIT